MVLLAKTLLTKKKKKKKKDNLFLESIPLEMNL